MIAVDKAGGSQAFPAVDAIFPLLHGQWGEDGSVQGLASVARLPLIGCGIIGSANALDKGLAKRLLSEAGLPTARSVALRRGENVPFETLAEALGVPYFLKPATQGSSVGVGKITSPDEFETARTLGFHVDHCLIAEEFIDGREIECAILEDADGHLFTSRPGEIATGAQHGFYTYEAKYVDAAGADLLVPAPLNTQLEKRVRSLAAEAFRAVGCDTMARVDVFLTGDDRLIVNELNTVPGFTDISMYPKAMAASGLSLPQLIDRLIGSAMVRFDGFDTADRDLAPNANPAITAKRET
ncbi:D-alanine--D-alanine ligase A [Roseovarius sp. THAF9]|nr:D-alanine--D-alanine ligase A [Roseovarius sp. THAF9]